MLKHPRELGFTLGLKIRIDEPASIMTRTSDASMSDVVYVALFAEETTRLEKGEALKVGQTKDSLMKRWKGIAGTFSRDNLRNNEIEDRRKWLKQAKGKEVAVWVKPAGKTSIGYAQGLTQHQFSTRCAEEEFLDE